MADSLPPKLYKYQPYSIQTLDNLKNRVIWFAKPATFNDPFDSSIVYKAAELTEDEWQALAERYLLKHPEDAKEFERLHMLDGKPDEWFRNIVVAGAVSGMNGARKGNQERGIACFCEQPDDMLMWGHYADGHRGLCLEFDTRCVIFKSAWKVHYSEKYPSMNIADAMIKGEIDALAMLTTKARQWEYEQEWRVLDLNGNKQVQIDAAALTGIYFGCAMALEHKAIVAMILRDLPTKLYEMQRSETEFIVRPRQLKFTPPKYAPNMPEFP